MQHFFNKMFILSGKMLMIVHFECVLGGRGGVASMESMLTEYLGF